MAIYQLRFAEAEIPESALANAHALGDVQQTRGRYVLVDTSAEQVQLLLQNEPRWSASILREPHIPEQRMRAARAPKRKADK